MRTVDDLSVAGQRVLLRSDLNVPLDLTGTGEITDEGRIRASLPVIRKLSDRGARVIILAHLGRPSGATFEERAAGGPSKPACACWKAVNTLSTAGAGTGVGVGVLPGTGVGVGVLRPTGVGVEVRFGPRVGVGEGRRTIVASRVGIVAVGVGVGVRVGFAPGRGVSPI